MIELKIVFSLSGEQLQCMSTFARWLILIRISNVVGKQRLQPIISVSTDTVFTLVINAFPLSYVLSNDKTKWNWPLDFWFSMCVRYTTQIKARNRKFPNNTKYFYWVTIQFEPFIGGISLVLYNCIIIYLHDKICLPDKYQVLQCMSLIVPVTTTAQMWFLLQGRYLNIRHLFYNV